MPSLWLVACHTPLVFTRICKQCTIFSTLLPLNMTCQLPAMGQRYLALTSTFVCEIILDFEQVLKFRISFFGVKKRNLNLFICLVLFN